MIFGGFNCSNPNPIVILSIVIVTTLLASLLFAQKPLLTRVHSHNDYMQARPLDEALENGFNSIEIDVFPLNGDLLVAHSAKEIKPDRTIESLYFDKLSARAKANKGAIYPGSRTTFWIMVDIKRNGEEAYTTLKQIIDRYPDLKPTKRNPKIRFVISGNRPYDLIAADNGAYAGIDGEFPDLEKHYSNEVMPWISGEWGKAFKWNGEGEIGPEDAAKMKERVNAIHGQRKLVRFWGSPDNERTWQAQWNAGVDLINTDHISELRKWILGRK